MVLRIFFTKKSVKKISKSTNFELIYLGLWIGVQIMIFKTKKICLFFRKGRYGKNPL